MARSARMIPELGRTAAAAVIASALVVSLALQLWGIERSLPYTAEVDESLIVLPASQIAASFDLNPRRFDYPGSTMIYPLALVHHVYEAAVRGGTWSAPNRSIATALATLDMRPYFLAGRLLSVAYMLGSIALVALIGVRLWGRTVGALGAVLAVGCSALVDIGQQARTDAAAAFYGALFLLACLRVLSRPSFGRQLAAGAALGLAAATRYFMFAAAPVLAAVEIALMRGHPRRERARDEQGSATTRAGVAAGAGLAFLGVVVAFAVSTPYFILDYTHAWSSFQVQAAKQQSHLGHDGLSPLGNLLWYVSTALPAVLTWPIYILSLAGAALPLLRRQLAPALATIYLASFLVAISSLGLHWERWLVPILPLTALLAAAALTEGIETAASAIAPLRGRAGAGAIAVITAALLLQPGVEQLRAARIRALPSTEIEAMRWIEQHASANTRIGQEWYTAPLSPSRYRLTTRFSLAAESLDFYRRIPVEIVMVSSAIYDRYLLEPARYPREVAFYRELFSTGTLLAEIAPSSALRGPTIRIYSLAAPPTPPVDPLRN